MRGTLLVVMTVLAVGCSSEKEPTETAETSREQRATAGGESDQTSEAMAANCPMNVQGTSVQAENVDGGSALVFTTTGDVTALRERVRNMAATRESASMQAGSQEMGMSETMHPGTAGGSSTGAKVDADDGVSAGGMPENSAAGSKMVDVDTQVEDVDGGARLVLIATNASDVDALRMQTEQQAERMTAGECPMAQQPPPTGDTMVQ